NDGCPLSKTDTDGDGITDDKDKCPTEPEDKDGFQDDDGCPDPDNDNDGIPDNFDTCPDEPEDMHGFQDEDGRPDPDNHQNVELSQKRADAVRAYLIKKGIDANRLLSVGYGASVPIADNKTKAGREANRRVEFHIVEEQKKPKEEPKPGDDQKPNEDQSQ